MLQRVYAQVSPSVSDPLSTLFGSEPTLAKVFGVAMNIIIGVAVSLSVVFLGLGGIKYITARGDAKSAEEARTWITNAVIGLVISIGALAVKTIVLDSLLGATLPGGDIIIDE